MDHTNTPSEGAQNQSINSAYIESLQCAWESKEEKASSSSKIVTLLNQAKRKGDIYPLNSLIIEFYNNTDFTDKEQPEIARNIICIIVRSIVPPKNMDSLFDFAGIFEFLDGKKDKDSLYFREQLKDCLNYISKNIDKAAAASKSEKELLDSVDKKNEANTKKKAKNKAKKEKAKLKKKKKQQDATKIQTAFRKYNKDKAAATKTQTAFRKYNKDNAAATKIQTAFRRITAFRKYNTTPIIKFRNKLWLDLTENNINNIELLPSSTHYTTKANLLNNLKIIMAIHTQIIITMTRTVDVSINTGAGKPIAPAKLDQDSDLYIMCPTEKMDEVKKAVKNLYTDLETTNDKGGTYTAAPAHKWNDLFKSFTQDHLDICILTESKKPHIFSNEEQIILSKGSYTIKTKNPAHKNSKLFMCDNIKEGVEELVKANWRPYGTEYGSLIRTLLKHAYKHILSNGYEEAPIYMLGVLQDPITCELKDIIRILDDKLKTKKQKTCAHGKTNIENMFEFVKSFPAEKLAEDYNMPGKQDTIVNMHKGLLKSERLKQQAADIAKEYSSCQ